MLLNAATHKLHFPKYDGFDDLLVLMPHWPWLHRCEQFFQVVHTSKTEKV
jgi:hypothetical protein